MSDSDPMTLYHVVAEGLNRFGLAFLEIRVALPDGADMLRMIRETFHGPLMLNESLTLDAANALIERGTIDLASFARPFISNPDLVERFAEAAPLAESDKTTWYGGEAKGYIDYPSLILAGRAPLESSRPGSDT
jgi:2,4-dienoyl-CoA reductase-like NADH-dependent reductase (Old Yellow Enzyme family)